LRAIVRRHDFSVLSGGRRQGEVDLDNHYRDGQPGAWREAFTTDHTRLFDSCYPTLLERIGYEPA
jgi:hypothetical protein